MHGSLRAQQIPNESYVILDLIALGLAFYELNHGIIHCVEGGAINGYEPMIINA